MYYLEFDEYSIGHLIFGTLIFIVLEKYNYSLLKNVVFSNIIHGIGELVEVLQGKTNYINNYGDILSCNVGIFLSYFFNLQKYVNSFALKIIYLILGIVLFNEIVLSSLNMNIKTKVKTIRI